MLRICARLLLPMMIVASLVAAPASAASAVTPGTVVEHHRTTVYTDQLKLLPVPVEAWYLRYRSTSATGTPNVVSGTLLVPSTAWSGGPRPLVGYAVGTHGMGDQCAPSNKLQEGTERELNLMAPALLRGWAVMVTDYEGLGTPGTHTYGVGQSEGRAVLDAARAAPQVPGSGLSPDGPVGVAGYSQGGQAAVFAGDLQPTYAPELNLVGVAAGGVPADLNEMLEFNDGAVGFSTMLAAGIGFEAAYPEVPFTSLLNDRGREAVEKIKDACTLDIAAVAPFGHLRDFFTVPDPTVDPRWQARLAENRAGEHKPDVPIFLYHAGADELVPLSAAKELVARYRELGVDVEWLEIPASEHLGGAFIGSPVAMDWLGKQF